MTDYIRKILDARVYDVASESPLDAMPRLSARLGRPVLLKREDLQPVFSFKLRGAYNKMANLSAEERARGVELVHELRLMTRSRDVLLIRLDARTGAFLEVAGSGMTEARRRRDD